MTCRGSCIMNANQLNATCPNFAIRAFFYSLISFFTFELKIFPHIFYACRWISFNGYHCRLHKKGTWYAFEVQRIRLTIPLSTCNASKMSKVSVTRVWVSLSIRQGSGRADFCFISPTFWILKLIYAFHFSSLYFEARRKQLKVDNLPDRDSYKVCFSTQVKAIIRNMVKIFARVHWKCWNLCAATLSALHLTLAPVSRLLHLLPFPCPPFFKPPLTVFSIYSSHLYITPISARWDGNWVGGLCCGKRWWFQGGQK